MQICDIGEQELLKRLQAFCPLNVVGDDAALMSVTPGHKLVVTTDVLVDGVHFSWGMTDPNLWTTSPQDAGWRAAAANLSDIAAMGAHPLGVTVGLSVPPHAAVADIEAFYHGLVECLTPFRTPIVGGDVCRSSVLTVAIAAFGDVLPQRAIQRSSAKPGDVILVTGYHGASRAGLELLLHKDAGQELAECDRQELIAAHQRPRPRLDVVERLQDIWDPIPKISESSASDSLMNPRMNHAIAGMDSSDGLADAVLQICRASRVGAVLDRSAIPIPPALLKWRSPQQAMHWALYGGEDFELVLCCDGAIAHRLLKDLDSAAAIIGIITPGSDVILSDPTGIWDDETLRLAQGFQHF